MKEKETIETIVELNLRTADGRYLDPEEFSWYVDFLSYLERHVSELRGLWEIHVKDPCVNAGAKAEARRAKTPKSEVAEIEESLATYHRRQLIVSLLREVAGQAQGLVEAIEHHG